jgi:predicted transcriptional regulator
MSTTAAAKRPGRPAKPPSPGRRTTVTLMMSPELKARIDEAAQAAGRTQSQEAELLLEQSLAVRDVLGAMRTTISEIARGHAEANFRRRGYAVIHSPHGDIWIPPGHPATPQPSGFIPPEEESS